jgi:hypothetical protein
MPEINDGNPNEQPGGPGETETGEQGTYLPPDIPDGYVQSPPETAFSNATYLLAESQTVDLVADVLDFEEFDDLRDMAFAVVWRRKSSPTYLLGDGEKMPLFATVELMPRRAVWHAAQLEVLDFPRIIVDLHWQHFADARRDLAFVHEATLKRFVHAGLSAYYVDNDILKRRPYEVQAWVKTVERYGIHDGRLRSLQRALDLWGDPSEGDDA